jgi:hypothetical protein
MTCLIRDTFVVSQATRSLNDVSRRPLTTYLNSISRSHNADVVGCRPLVRSHGRRAFAKVLLVLHDIIVEIILLLKITKRDARRPISASSSAASTVVHTTEQATGALERSPQDRAALHCFRGTRRTNRRADRRTSNALLHVDFRSRHHTFGCQVYEQGLGGTCVPIIFDLRN